MDPRLEDAVRRARSGDPRAFRVLADHLGPDLVRFVTFLLGGDVHAAHDVAQDTLIRAWDELDAIQDLGHLRRWAYRVARCRAISWVRRTAPPGRRVESLDLDLPSGGHRARLLVEDPPRAERQSLARALRQALRVLPPKYAGPVHLHYVQGCSTRETADLLGVTRGTVKMRLLRARSLLRRELDRALGPKVAAPSLERRAPP